MARRAAQFPDRAWGLPGFSPAEREVTNSDSALFIKQLGLWKRAQECQQGKPVAFFLESPRD